MWQSAKFERSVFTKFVLCVPEEYGTVMYFWDQHAVMILSILVIVLLILTYLVYYFMTSTDAKKGEDKKKDKKKRKRHNEEEPADHQSDAEEEPRDLEAGGKDHAEENHQDAPRDN